MLKVQTKEVKIQGYLDEIEDIRKVPLPFTLFAAIGGPLEIKSSTRVEEVIDYFGPMISDSLLK